MARNIKRFTLLLHMSIGPLPVQQITIPRIELMSNIPQPT